LDLVLTTFLSKCTSSLSVPIKDFRGGAIEGIEGNTKIVVKRKDFSLLGERDFKDKANIVKVL
jgi:hypothetical protein